MKPLLKRVGAFLLENNRNASLVAFLFSLLPLIGLPVIFASVVRFGDVTPWLARRIVGFTVGCIGLVLVCSMLGAYDILLARFALMWLFAGLLQVSRGRCYWKWLRCLVP